MDPRDYVESLIVEFVRDFHAARASQRETETNIDDPIEHMTPEQFQNWYEKYWPMTM